MGEQISLTRAYEAFGPNSTEEGGEESSLTKKLELLTQKFDAALCRSTIATLRSLVETLDLKWDQKRSLGWVNTLLELSPEILERLITGLAELQQEQLGGSLLRAPGEIVRDSGVVPLNTSHEQMLEVLRGIPQEVLDDLTLIVWDRHLDIYEPTEPGRVDKATWILTALSENLARRVVVLGISKREEVVRRKNQVIEVKNGMASPYASLTRRGKLIVFPADRLVVPDWGKVIQTGHVLMDVDIDVVAGMHAGCEYSLMPAITAFGSIKQFSESLQALLYGTIGENSQDARSEALRILIETTVGCFVHFASTATKPSEQKVLASVRAAQLHCDRKGVARKIRQESGVEILGTVSEFLPNYDFLGQAGEFVEQLSDLYSQ